MTAEYKLGALAIEEDSNGNFDFEDNNGNVIATYDIGNDEWDYQSETVKNLLIDLDGNDLTDGAAVIWDTSNSHIPQGRLENDSITVTAGDGLTNGGSVALGGSITPDVQVSDFAGALLSDDGSNNLQVDEGNISHDAIDQATVSEGDHRTTEQVQDIVDALLQAGDKLSLTYDDANGTLTVDTSALDTEEVEDAVNTLVSGGGGITTTYDDANNALTLSIPDNSVTASMLVEAYYTQSEANNRFYNVSGDTLEGDIDYGNFEGQNAGKDGVRVPSSREDLTVADFEGGTLADDFVGDTSNATVQSSVVLEGSYSLKLSLGSTGGTFVGRSNSVDTAPQLGDVFSYYVYFTDTEDVAAITFGQEDPSTRWTNTTAYVLRLRADNGSAVFIERLGQDTISTTSANIPFSNHLNEVLEVRFTTTVDGEVTYQIFEGSGTEIGSGTIQTDSRMPETGGVQYEAENRSVAPTSYFDGPFLTRRTPEYYSNTQNGVTELGNEVTPSGAINTGPQEAIVSDTTVHGVVRSDDGLSAGSDIELVEWDAGVGRRSLKAQADGNGGLYGLRSPLARRLTTQLDWEYESLADVPAWSSAASDSNFTFNLNSRPRRLHVDHTGDTDAHDHGGLVASVLTTYQSLGPLRITFLDVSYSNNVVDNQLRLGLTDVNSPDTSVTSNGNGIFYLLTSDGVDKLSVVNAGTRSNSGLSSSVDWTTNHDVTIEYDGGEVRILIDGDLRASLSYNVNTDFSPFIQLFDDKSTSTAETVEAEDVTVEEL